ncbi:MAG: hypothetical protein IPK80_17325 [Nannocystis sp.]|nr:hypothetical protein [Nannocystis sp.]
MKWSASLVLLGGAVACSPAPSPAPALSEPAPSAMQAPPREEARAPAPAQPLTPRGDDADADAQLLTYAGQLSVIDPAIGAVAVREVLPLRREDKLIVGEGAVALLYLKNGYLVRLDDDLELLVRELALIDAPPTTTSLDDQLDALVGGALKVDDRARITGWQQGLHAGFGGTIGGVQGKEKPKDARSGGTKKTLVDPPARPADSSSDDAPAAAAPPIRRSDIEMDARPTRNRGNRGGHPGAPPEVEMSAPPKPPPPADPPQPPRFQHLKDGADPELWTPGLPLLVQSLEDQLRECIAPQLDKREDRDAPIVLLIACEDDEIKQTLLVGAPPNACLADLFRDKSDGECQKGWLRIELPRRSK